MLSNPHSMLICEMLKVSWASSLQAYPIRISVMYCIRVFPVFSLKNLQNAVGFMAARDEMWSRVMFSVYFLFM